MQETEVSIPTRKRRTSDDSSEKDSSSVSLCEKAVRISPLMKRNKRKSKNSTEMLKMLLLVPISFFLLAALLCSEGL